MCGILLFSGPKSEARLREGLHRLKHRGPDDQCNWSHNDIALGFARLIINGDISVGRQPYEHEDMICVVNGEIYNHQEIRHTYGLPESASDTELVLPLFIHSGTHIIDELDGFYSALIIQQKKREAICLRDHMGKKPLFVGRSKTEIFITSEMKTIDECDWFELLPRGISKVNLDTGDVVTIAAHYPVEGEKKLVTALEEAVLKRMPEPDLPVGIFLSGGLDSSLIAAFASKLRSDITYFTLSGQENVDYHAVKIVADALKLIDLRVVPLPKLSELPELVKAVVYATESVNPSIVSNGLATFLLAQASHNAGIKVVLTGEGADELFGGYHIFSEQEPWSEVRSQLIDDMQCTELRRLDMSCMAHSVEPRCPFLDRHVRAISDELAYSELYDKDENKVLLRRSFDELLPIEILRRKKTSFDVGSGIRGLVVQYLRRNGRSERDELQLIWDEFFSHDRSEPYFHAYPTFDSAIDRRGETHKRAI